jgi:hypothetical protein
MRLEDRGVARNDGNGVVRRIGGARVPDIAD